jgi:hypothetical protein
MQCLFPSSSPSFHSSTHPRLAITMSLETSVPHRKSPHGSTIFLGLLLILVSLSGLFSVTETVGAVPTTTSHHSMASKRQSPTQEVHLAHLHLADKVFTDIEDILDSPVMDSCQMCLKGMQVAQTFSLEAPELVSGVLRSLCTKYAFMRLDSCAGTVENGKEPVDIFQVLLYRGKLIDLQCFFFVYSQG